ncbi:leucine-rich repeat domain-containing protein [Marinifilum sp. D737]|uniref:leucine-rich repeat domain-containing protein n=1 Tax=Marinifilum sp. D737 TaxID=2969628 RepID=UPI0022729C11|nr:leucine-rich repeat domain-containing protein [Marinifilum sp. D737]MCY1636554.1 leucine-rich repeat domain-containing protein [Marinifilum sp. D737]
MKNIYKYFLLIVLCSCLFISCEKDELYGETANQSDNWKYVEVDGGIRLIEYIGELSQVIKIPAEINGKPVIEVKGNGQIQVGIFNQDASNQDKLVKSIEVNSDLREIGEFAFAYCVGLEEITGFEKVQNIGRGGFLGCEILKLNGSPFSNEIKYIGYRAFEGCEKMDADIDLSNRGELTIAPNAFANCLNLQSINLNGTTVKIDLTAVEGTQVPLASLIDYLSLTAIPESFLENNQDIETLDLSSWPLESIGKNAFKGSAVKQIILPETVSFISSAAFQNCALESIDLSKTKIKVLLGGFSDGVFRNCSSLKSIKFPPTLESMPNASGSALRGCSALESIDISMLKEEVIGSGFFRDCSSIKSIVFSPYVKEIQGFVFWFSSNSLQEITIQRNTPGDLTVLKASAFTYKNTGFTIVNYPAGTNYPNEPVWADLIKEGVSFNPIL